MQLDKFLIAPIKSGEQRNVKPWLIMDDAFETMRNIYTWRGTVKKRFGSRLMNESKNPPQDQLFSRLRVNIGTTDVAGDFHGMIGISLSASGQLFSIGDEVFTLTSLGNPSVLLTTGGSTVHEFDTTTKQLDIVGSIALTTIFIYIAQPVMALTSYQIPDETVETLYAFDNFYMYSFSYNTGWNRVTGTGASAGINQWSGTDSDFFWTTNYRGAQSFNFLMFITNNIVADGFRYWNGTDFFQLGTVGTTPINLTGDFIETCKIIVPFKDRLILMNVTENVGASSNNYGNRIRWSQNGSPVAADAWLQFPTVGKGGFLEAPTKESIISTAFIKDRLIVFFERSSWELVYTGNTSLPFSFQKLNAELGVESTNSIIEFDRILLGFGSTGIHGCNGLNVERVDQAIPDTIFEVNNTNASQKRVYGIRDYFIEASYWAYNSVEEQTRFNDIYPNRVLVFDYVNKTWSYNDDSITAFGSFYLQRTLTWNDLVDPWFTSDISWSDPSSQDKFQAVIAGNQEGWTFIVDTKRSSNCKSLQITNVFIAGPIVTFQVENHNLADQSFVYLRDIQDNGGNLATFFNDRIFQVYSTPSYFDFEIDTGATQVTGTYIGGGTISRVSQIVLDTKQYNFYNKEAFKIAVNKIDFLVDKTSTGQIAVSDYVSTSDFINETNILETTAYPTVPLEATQNRFWHTVYMNSFGENIQLSIYLSDEQMLDPNIALADFQLNAMLFFVNPVNQF